MPIWNPSGSGGGGSLPVGKTLYVDAVNGNNATGSRTTGKPYLTLEAAVAATQSGDLVHIRPGTYTPAAPIGFTGAMWADGGAIITASASLFVSAAGMKIDVLGNGAWTASGSLIDCNHADAVIRMVGLSGVGGHAINQTAGKVQARFFDFGSNNGQAAIWWSDGPCDVQFFRGTAADGDYPFVFVSTNGNNTPTGELHVVGHEMLNTQATGPDSSGVLQVGGAVGSEYRIWITVNKMACAGPLGNLAYCLGGKVYITTEKGVGAIVANGSELHYTTQKHNGTVSAQAGIVNLEIGNLDDTGLDGVDLISSQDAAILDLTLHRAVRTTSGNVFNLSSTDSTIRGGYAKSISGSDVAAVSGGKARFIETVLDSSAAAANNPIVVSGGGRPILQGAILVSSGTQKSITAATAQVATSMGGFATVAVHSNVTLSGALTVGSYVQ